MELRIPAPEEVRRFYDRCMKSAFPAAELKPLTAIERMWQKGKYKPYCLYDDDGMGPVGCAFLWLGRPGWALLDYLCVDPGWRNDGFGAEMLRLLPRVEPHTVIFGEVEVPEDAPDPAMAKRRMGFYARNGFRLAEYETEVFGVHYKTLYLADRKVAEEELMREHDNVYRSSFTPEKYDRYVRIPFVPGGERTAQIPWEQ